jgi:hypothetical protein
MLTFGALLQERDQRAFLAHEPDTTFDAYLMLDRPNQHMSNQVQPSLFQVVAKKNRLGFARVLCKQQQRWAPMLDVLLADIESKQKLTNLHNRMQRSIASVKQHAACSHTTETYLMKQNGLRHISPMRFTCGEMDVQYQRHQHCHSNGGNVKVDDEARSNTQDNASHGYDKRL